MIFGISWSINLTFGNLVGTNIAVALKGNHIQHRWVDGHLPGWIASFRIEATQMVHAWYATIFDSHGRVIALNHGCTSTELQAFFFRLKQRCGDVIESEVAETTNLLWLSISIDDERLACWCRSVAETIYGGKWATLIGSPRFTFEIHLRSDDRGWSVPPYLFDANWSNEFFRGQHGPQTSCGLPVDSNWARTHKNWYLLGCGVTSRGSTWHAAARKLCQRCLFKGSSRESFANWMPSALQWWTQLRSSMFWHRTGTPIPYKRIFQQLLWPWLFAHLLGRKLRTRKRSNSPELGWERWSELCPDMPSMRVEYHGVSKFPNLGANWSYEEVRDGKSFRT